mmetsp:Transcript_6965/g.13153  ORF Transcript_6965/g.13153 Transcript_6965/m.13153 type:complete len:279 (+) Transcript_6965:201-1037(+)
MGKPSTANKACSESSLPSPSVSFLTFARCSGAPVLPFSSSASALRLLLLVALPPGACKSEVLWLASGVGVEPLASLVSSPTVPSSPASPVFSPFLARGLRRVYFRLILTTSPFAPNTTRSTSTPAALAAAIAAAVGAAAAVGEAKRWGASPSESGPSSEAFRFREVAALSFCSPSLLSFSFPSLSLPFGVFGSLGVLGVFSFFSLTSFTFFSFFSFGSFFFLLPSPSPSPTNMLTSSLGLKIWLKSASAWASASWSFALLSPSSPPPSPSFCILKPPA